MPESFPPVHPYPGKYRTMADAAKEGLIVTLRCNRCRRTVNFLAWDLVEIIGPKHYLHVPSFPCTRCGTIEYVAVAVKTAKREDLGNMIVRRPAGTVQLWRNETLGELGRARVPRRAT